MSLDITLTNHCDYCGHDYSYSCNITHNLGQMAREAGIYDLLWNASGKAGAMIKPLAKAIIDMEARPEYYRQFDAPNGWGIYDDFLPWLNEILQQCVDNPEAVITVDK